MVNEKLVLEPSTNTHVLEAQGVKMEKVTPTILKLQIKGEGIVSHGEHGTLVTETEHVIKYVQQEYNPVTRAMQNAFD